MIRGKLKSFFRKIYMAQTNNMRTMSVKQSDAEILAKCSIKIEFGGKFGCLHNFHMENVVVDGIQYKSGAHAMCGEILQREGLAFTHPVSSNTATSCRDLRKRKLIDSTKWFSGPNSCETGEEAMVMYDQIMREFSPDYIEMGRIRLSMRIIQSEICEYKLANSSVVKEALVTSDGKTLIYTDTNFTEDPMLAGVGVVVCSDNDSSNNTSPTTSESMYVRGGNVAGVCWMLIRFKI